MTPNKSLSLTNNYDSTKKQLYIKKTSKLTIPPSNIQLKINIYIINKTIETLTFNNMVNIEPINNITISNNYDQNTKILYINKNNNMKFPNSNITLQSTLYLSEQTTTLNSIIFKTDITLKNINKISLNNTYNTKTHNLYLNKTTKNNTKNIETTITTSIYINFTDPNNPKLNKITIQKNTTINPFKTITISKS